MTSKKVIVLTTRARYELIIHSGIMRTEIDQIYSKGGRLGPINKFVQQDPSKFQILGCYFGPLESGEYALSTQRKIKKDISMKFIKGGKIVILKKHRRKISLSSVIQDVRTTVLG